MSNISNPLREAARRRPDKTFIHAANAKISFRAAEDRVARYRDALRARGLADQAVLGIAMEPSPDYPLLILACMEVGIVACPLNLRWPPEAMAQALRGVDAQLVVLDAETEKLAHDGSWEGIATLRVDQLVRDEGEALRDAFDESQPAAIVFTSGSTGKSKAALLSVGNLFYNAVGCNQVIPLHEGDGWLLSLPLYHVSGLGILWRCLLSGASIVIPGGDQPFADSVADERVTHVSCVATQVQRLIADTRGARALSRLKAIMLGGGPVPATLIRECVRHELPVHITYGMTETASQICTTRSGVPMHELFTAGKPQEPDTVALDDDGQIYVRGQRLFLGYLSHGQLERPFSPEGWFGTGDLGRFDEAGNLIPLGRADNMFISGGENVHPESIERELGRIVGVQEAMVVPVDDTEFGKRPVAFVRMAHGGAPDGDVLAEALRERLPGYARPVAYYPWPEDLTGGMKPRRSEFVALAARLRGSS